MNVRGEGASETPWRSVGGAGPPGCNNSVTTTAGQPNKPRRRAGAKRHRACNDEPFSGSHGEDRGEGGPAIDSNRPTGVDWEPGGAP